METYSVVNVKVYAQKKYKTFDRPQQKNSLSKKEGRKNRLQII